MGDSSVCRTAKDALQAKLSAYEAGYRLKSLDEQGSKEYGDLIRQAGSFFNLNGKRQSPLINAGYAVRVALILRQISNFVQYHDEGMLIVLGAGLDVTGLWALARCTKVQVIEIDLPEICSAKRQFLSDSGLFKSLKEEEDWFYSGITTHGHEQSEYSLIQADLIDVAGLHSKLSRVLETNAHKKHATMVLSELVLSYVETHDSEKLLRYCSSTLCAAENSCLVLYEPLGPSSSDDSSVLASYRKAYSRQFETKLKSGQAEKCQNKHSSSLFVPLADSPQGLMDRLSECGFPRAESALVGLAFKACMDRAFHIQEQFDEHSSFLLHLATYSISVAFSQRSDDLVHWLCPWKSGRIRPRRLDCRGGQKICLQEIRGKHDGQVRDLFERIYKPYFSKYRSIHKMYKSTLKNGHLASSCSNSSGDTSQIGQRFRDQSGLFLVATLNDDFVVGSVGIRKCSAKEQLKSTVRKAGSYEVHHLLTDPEHRRMGIARSLLGMAQELVSAPRIVATTVSPLEDALLFYQSGGFTVVDQDDLGDLSTITFAK